MPAPLDGIQVLDLSRALAGPYCSMMLGDMGATVIKVEQPGIGDTTRAWGPPFEGGESSYYLSVNRNKQSIALDLRHPQATQVLHKLIARSDVLLENFVPGTLERLGLGYEVCRALKPDLIYCTISGFGLTGPDRARAAYDQIVQGLGGIMSLTGEPDGPPTRVGIALSDIMAGMFAAYAIVAALYHRQQHGVGQFVDTSLLEGQLAMLTSQAGSYFATGQVPARSGLRHPAIVPYGVYRAADGYFNLAVGTDALWRRFCTALGREDLLADVRYASNPARLAQRATLEPLLEAVFATMTIGDIEARLTPAGVPCGAIADMAGVFQNPQVAALGSVVTVAHPTAGQVRLVGPPYRLSEAPPTIRNAPPLLGEHTDAVLAGLGYSAAMIGELRASGAVG